MKTYLSELKWLENQDEVMTKMIINWSSINSWSDNLNGLHSMLNILVKDFSILKGDIQVVSLPSRHIIGPKGIIIEKPSAKALSIRKRPHAPIQVFLGGHMDTVYPPRDTPVLPTQMGSKLIGQGVTDMKGGLVILLKALEAFERSHECKSVGWEILINPDEEIGSPCSHHLFVEAARRNQIGLIFEPSFSDGSFVSKRKGSANYTVIARGKAAHAGRDFAEGQSAIFAMTHFLHELEKIKFSDSTTVNVGYIEGGGVTNIVPDFTICRINVRANSDKDMLDVKDKMEILSKVCQKRKGITLQLVEETFRVPKPFDNLTENLFKHYKNCSEQLKLPFSLRESGGVTDGNILSHEGLPTLDSIGALGGNIHTEDEYLELPSLVPRAQLASLLLHKLSIGDIRLLS